jgi:hypothetical protein
MAHMQLTSAKVPKLPSMEDVRTSEQSVDDDAMPARSVSMSKLTVIDSPLCSNTALVMMGDAQYVNSVLAKI